VPGKVVLDVASPEVMIAFGRLNDDGEPLFDVTVRTPSDRGKGSGPAVFLVPSSKRSSTNLSPSNRSLSMQALAWH